MMMHWSRFPSFVWHHVLLLNLTKYVGWNVVINQGNNCPPNAQTHRHTPKLYTVFGIHIQYNRNCLSLLLLFLRRSKGRGTGKGLLKGCVTFWLKLQWNNWRFLRILKSVSSFAIMWCNVFSGGETINNNTHTHTFWRNHKKYNTDC